MVPNVYINTNKTIVLKGIKIMWNKIVKNMTEIMYQYVKHQDCIRYTSLYKMLNKY